VRGQEIMIPISIIEGVEKINMTYRILIFVGILLLLSAVFIFAVYMPNKEEISQLTQEINSLEQKISQAKIRASNLAKFEEEEIGHKEFW